METESPTPKEVKNYFLDKGYHPQLIDQAMEYVDYKFGSWRGFHTFVVDKMIKFMEDRQMYSSIRQVANGC